MSNTNEAGKKLVDVLLRLKKYTMESLAVAEVAIVTNTLKEENSFQTRYKCELINNSNVTLVCDKLSNVDGVTEGSRVVILFTDTDFRANMLKIRSGGQRGDLISKELHSMAYGIIIGTLQ